MLQKMLPTSFRREM